MPKGVTPWFPRHVRPARLGTYECVVRISSSVPALLWRLEWDGTGFIVPFPMMVDHWRGLTKRAHAEAAQEGKSHDN